MINKKIILIILLLPVLVNAQDSFYYYSFSVDFTDSAKFNDVDLFLQLEGIGNNYYDYFGENYRIKLYGEKENLLVESEFSPGKKVIVENGEVEEYKNQDGRLVLPYFEDAHRAVIYDSENMEIDSILVSQYSKRGFNINDFNGNVILDEEVDSDKIVRKPVDSEGIDPVVAGLGVLLVLLIGVWVVLVKKKN